MTFQHCWNNHYSNLYTNFIEGYEDFPSFFDKVRKYLPTNIISLLPPLIDVPNLIALGSAHEIFDVEVVYKRTFSVRNKTIIDQPSQKGLKLIIYV